VNLFMPNFLDNLRSKPERAKTRFAFTAALIATLVIVGLWFPISKINISEQVQRADSADADGPLQSLGFIFADTWNGMKGKIGGIKNSFSALGTVSSLPASSDALDISAGISATSTMEEGD
jgi:hypothetical protein